MQTDPKDRKRKLMSNVHGLRRQIYITANNSPDPIRIECGTAKEAHTVRYSFYAAGRHIKLNAETDPEGLKAVDNVILSVQGSELVLTRSEDTTEGKLLLAAIAAMGMTPDAIGPREIAERTALANTERLLQIPTVQQELPFDDYPPQPVTEETLEDRCNGTTVSDLAHLFDNLTQTEEQDTQVVNPYPRRL